MPQQEKAAGHLEEQPLERFLLLGRTVDHETHRQIVDDLRARRAVVVLCRLVWWAEAVGGLRRGGRMGNGREVAHLLHGWCRAIGARISRLLARGHGERDGVCALPSSHFVRFHTLIYNRSRRLFHTHSPACPHPHLAATR